MKALVFRGQKAWETKADPVILAPTVDIDSRCVGYRVDSPDGRIGSIAAVLPPRGGRRDVVVLVKTGLLTCSLTAVPSAAVGSVDASRRRVLLRRSVQQREPEPRGACDCTLTSA
jgi:hypothetical protein